MAATILLGVSGLLLAVAIVGAYLFVAWERRTAAKHVAHLPTPSDPAEPLGW